MVEKMLGWDSQWKGKPRRYLIHSCYLEPHSNR